MKTSLRKILCMILAVTMILLLAGCKKNAEQNTDSEGEVSMEEIADEQAEGTEDYDNGIYFDEEADGAEIVAKKKSSDEFVGSWKATSGQSIYQYGNVDIEVKEDGTWSGNVSGEPLTGKWSETDEGLHLTSDLFDCDLMFTEDNVLVMRYSPNEDGEYLTTVLTKK